MPPLRHLATLALFALAPLALARPESATLPTWHTQTLSFEGPYATETDELNPFTDYRLLVRFTHAESASEYWIRGFFAADGRAADTSAEAGNVWRARFTPDKAGQWNYHATLHRGPLIAISDDPAEGVALPLAEPRGSFAVTPPEIERGARDFRHRGRLVVDRDSGYFRFQRSDRYFLKGGADSPENFLAYTGFDGTYRYSDQHREGESQPTGSLHSYLPHLGDWTADDPTWQRGKGKGIIGALNYLADAGMNAVYFLTMNIEGDGKDVWPYRSHQDFARFDCSKLAQWDVVFRHAQSRGILLHFVTQETENERLLDDGNTHTYRKLYYKELVARFAHHNAIVWNLGEENGPADFSPHGQTAEQQKAMASYLKTIDPYRHPVVIHTHSHRSQKDHLLPDLLGHEPLDGLSFQVDDPLQVHDETKKWIRKSVEAGHRWLIGMDEIGPWQVGVAHDEDDPDHDLLRRHVLWGSLMAGAAGVEWYFGAHQKGNDLDTEDWRSRANMWQQTRHALELFQRHLPYWELRPADELTPADDDYCLAQPGRVYAIYLPDAEEESTLELGQDAGAYHIRWYSPTEGGRLQLGSVRRIVGPGPQPLGFPPKKPEDDWVVIVQRIQP